MSEGVVRWSEDAVADPLGCLIFIDLGVLGDGNELPVTLPQGRKR